MSPCPLRFPNAGPELPMTNPHSIVARDAWLEARLALLAKEKEFTRLRDQLNQQRHDLPWERVAKTYVYDGPDGAETLAQLFAGNSQLIAYHFMFALDWDSGCPSRSFIGLTNRF